MNLKPKMHLSSWRWCGIVVTLLILFGAAFVSVHRQLILKDEYSRRALIQANLNEIGQGLTKYRSTNHSLPPLAITDPDGNPLLSWRVALLPYVGEVQLFHEFHFDESWDSLHNAQLVPRMPRIYHDYSLSSRLLQDGFTSFLCISNGKGKVGDCFLRTSGEDHNPRLDIILIDGQKPVPWTRPEDFPMSSVSELRLSNTAIGTSVHALSRSGSVAELSLRQAKTLIPDQSE